MSITDLIVVTLIILGSVLLGFILGYTIRSESDDGSR